MSSTCPSWSVFDGLRVPTPAPTIPPTWEAAACMHRVAVDAAGTSLSELREALARWHAQLEPTGGEPTFRDWSSFRPLRLSREEDWSDWLQHLVAASKHGFLARELLGDPEARVERVEREVATDEGFRADLVIAWSGDRWSHVEVKIGDLAFEKTYGTADALRRRFCASPATRWTDHILVPPSHLGLWGSVAGARQSVQSLDWSDVAVALRRAISAAAENVDWRVWATAFTGAIEQTLLGLPRHDHAAQGPMMLGQALEALSHLELLRRAETP